MFKYFSGAAPAKKLPQSYTVTRQNRKENENLQQLKEEYVTIVQDGQTYAIPLTEYQTMQPGGTITIQVILLVIFK